MRYSIVSSKSDNSVPSSITLFVALYLIILAFFIILTKDLSFDEYKKTVAMHSIFKTFGHPKTQEIYFGVIDEGKIDQFPAELEKIFKDNAEIIVTADSSKFSMRFDKDYLYYGDEANFKPEISEKIVLFRDIVRRWNERDKPSFVIGMSLTNYEIDKQRLDYFRSKFGDIQFKTGLNIDQNNKFEIIVESQEGSR